MSKEKLFCTVDIPTAEVAAYIEALLCTTPRYVLNNLQKRPLEHFNKYFPGGIDGAKALERSGHLESAPVMEALTVALRAVGITETSAPWTKPQAPTEIYGNDVTYRPEGVVVGCRSLGLEQMRAMVAKCEGMGHDGGMATP